MLQKNASAPKPLKTEKESNLIREAPKDELKPSIKLRINLLGSRDCEAKLGVAEKYTLSCTESDLVVESNKNAAVNRITGSEFLSEHSRVW